MQIIYVCNECGSKNVDQFKTTFKESIKTIQGEGYNYKECEVVFICNDCGESGEDSFIYLEKESESCELFEK